MIEEEYCIKSKPNSSGNPQEKSSIDIIHQVLVNLVHTYTVQETYADDDNPWMVILSAEKISLQSTYNIIKDNI